MKKMSFLNQWIIIFLLFAVIISEFGRNSPPVFGFLEVQVELSFSMSNSMYMDLGKNQIGFAPWSFNCCGEHDVRYGITENELPCVKHLKSVGNLSSVWKVKSNNSSVPFEPRQIKSEYDICWPEEASLLHKTSEMYLMYSEGIYKNDPIFLRSWPTISRAYGQAIMEYHNAGWPLRYEAPNGIHEDAELNENQKVLLRNWAEELLKGERVIDNKILENVPVIVHHRAYFIAGIIVDPTGFLHCQWASPFFEGERVKGTSSCTRPLSLGYREGGNMILGNYNKPSVRCYGCNGSSSVVLHSCLSGMTTTVKSHAMGIVTCVQAPKMSNDSFSLFTHEGRNRKSTISAIVKSSSKVYTAKFDGHLGNVSIDEAFFKGKGPGSQPLLTTVSKDVHLYISQSIKHVDKENVSNATTQVWSKYDRVRDMGSTDGATVYQGDIYPAVHGKSNHSKSKWSFPWTGQDGQWPTDENGRFTTGGPNKRVLSEEEAKKIPKRGNSSMNETLHKNIRNYDLSLPQIRSDRVDKEGALTKGEKIEIHANFVGMLTYGKKALRMQPIDMVYRNLHYLNEHINRKKLTFGTPRLRNHFKRWKNMGNLDMGGSDVMDLSEDN